jgi:enoyl-CoA hydratase/carnithine racemase
MAATKSTSNIASLQDGFGGIVKVRTESDVAIITMERGENRMNNEFIDQVNAALDEALRNPDLKGIITTGVGKFYTNGLDLLYMMEMYQKEPENLEVFLKRWNQLQIRMLTCPVVTVSAINGHAFAGGAIFSLCHDFRVMQTERGWWCMNEAQLGLVIPDWILRIFRTKLGGNGGRTLIDSVTYAKRYPAAEAMAAGIADETCPAAELIPRSLDIIRKIIPGEIPPRDYVEKTKQRLYSDILDCVKSKSSYDFKGIASKL